MFSHERIPPTAAELEGRISELESQIDQLNRDLTTRDYVLDQLFSDSPDGFALVLFDRPVIWQADAAKDDLLDNVVAPQRVDRANDALLAAYGAQNLSRADLTVADLWRLGVEDGRAQYRRLFDQGALTYETAVVQPNGSLAVLDVSAMVMRDPAGAILGLYIMTRDVTEKKRVERTLKESEALFSNALQIAKMGHWEYDVASGLFRFSDEFYKMLHTTAEEMGGYTMSPERYTALFLHPDDAWLVAEETRRVLESTDPDYRRVLTHRIFHADGDHGHIEVTITRIQDEQGKTVKVRGVNQDITERKLAEIEVMEREKMYRNIFDNSNTSIWNLDLTGLVHELNRLRAQKVTDIQAYLRQRPEELSRLMKVVKIKEVNRETLRLFKAKSERQIRRSICDILGPDFTEVFTSHIWAIWSRKTSFHTEATYSALDGSRLRVMQSSPIPDSLEEFKSIPVSLLDITEWRRAEDMVRRSQKMDALGHLTGGVAHDYNNMLSIISGYTGLLAEAVKDQPTPAKYCQAIGHAASRSAALTQKLLAFSGKPSTNPKAVDLNAFVMNERDMLERTLTSRLTLLLDLDDALWGIRVDSGDLEDAVVNLCINAMQATEGTGMLSIRTRNSQITATEAAALDVDPGDYVCLSITDTGCGMSDAIQERVFDPFFSTKGEGGTGLGLSQVYGFAKRSRAAIKIKSTLGRGTDFQLYFPRYHNQTLSKPGDVPAFAPESQATGTILVVDDEPALVELAWEILVQKGYDVVCAHSAKEALDLLKSQHVDLLLTDVIMPHMDGFELAALTRERFPTVKILLVSGYSGVLNVETTDPSYTRDVLRKPYSSQKLLQRIHDLLHAD